MSTQHLTKNWEIGTSPSVLEMIHQKEVNIAIYERDITSLELEIEKLIHQQIEIQLSGEVETIINAIREVLNENEFPRIIEDIEYQLYCFKRAAEGHNFRLMLATVNTNMCRRFHTDINDLRLLCTYDGPGTLWLTEDNVNRKALNSRDENHTIVIDKNEIQQAKKGALVILKGAVYPIQGTKAVVHRSPTIEESGETRLLLRIDTNEFLNFH